MSDAIEPPAPEHEDMTARLLRLAGARPAVAADRAARVRTAVHRHWQLESRRRTLRRRAIITIGVMGAAAAVLLVIIRMGTPAGDVAPAQREAVGTLERIEGVARGMAPGTAVRALDWLDTGPTARAALRLPDDTSVRLDVATRMRLLSRSVIELTSGALYIDTGHDATGRASESQDRQRIEVRTPLGAVHDIGTQFEIRLHGDWVRVRVRTGAVELRRGNRSAAARPGTEVTMGAAGVESRTVSSFGPDWEWAAAVAPAFNIEGRPLAAFLEHLAREHGWVVRYGDAQLARDASGIILHGSVSGLQPRDALAVVLATSGLAHRFRDGELTVFRDVNRH